MTTPSTAPENKTVIATAFGNWMTGRGSLLNLLRAEAIWTIPVSPN